jgi:hypothetical protein
MPDANKLGWSDEQIDEFKQIFYSFDEDGEAPSRPLPSPPSPLRHTTAAWTLCSPAQPRSPRVPSGERSWGTCWKR